jgi:hypothetical protein
MKTLVLALAAALAPAGLLAQTLSKVTVEPAEAKAGEPVKITVAFTEADNPNCNMRLHFGDGSNRDFKINQAKDMPVVVSYTYAKAGEYRLRAEGKTALPRLKCLGADQRAVLKVVAPMAAATAKSGPTCPEGWKLDAKSVVKKSGAYTCTAKPGTAAPASKLACPAPLGYFENASKGQLGCRP